jgi:hypothetical protein
MDRPKRAKTSKPTPSAAGAAARRRKPADLKLTEKQVGKIVGGRKGNDTFTINP